MATIGELIIDLKANTASFVTDLNRVKNLSFETAAQVQRSFSVIGAVGLGMVGTLAAGMAHAIDKTAEWEVHMLHLSQSAGVTTETMSGLSHVAKMMEIDIDKVALAMARFDKQLLSAQQGNKKAVSMMETLGIDPKQIKTSDDALMLMADHFSKMKDGALKTGEAMQAFGKAGAQMIPILNLGRKGITEFIDEAKRMGIVITKEQAEAAEIYNQNIERMKETLHGLVVEITNKVVPVFNDFTAHLRADAKSMGGFQAVMDLFVVMMQQPKEIDAYFKAAKQMSELEVEKRKQIKNTEEHTVATAAHAKELEKLQKAIQAVIKEYETQAATLGMTALQVQLYKFQVDAAAISEQKSIQIGLERIRMLDEELKLAQKKAAIEQEKSRRNIQAFNAPGELEAMRQAIELTIQLNKQDFGPLRLQPQLEKFKESIQDQTKALQDQIRTWGMTNEQIVRYNLLRIDSSNASKQQVADLKVLQDRVVALQNAEAEQAKRQYEMHRAWQDFSRVAVRSFDELIFSGKKFSAVIMDITRLIGEMLLKWALVGQGGTGGLLGGIFKGLSGVLGGLFGGLAGGGAGGSLIGAGFTGLATGGPAMAGQTYMVGENGPEVFRPNTSGTIIPNKDIGKMTGGVTVINNYTIDARGADVSVEARIMRAMQLSENRAVARALQTAREASARAA